MVEVDSIKVCYGEETALENFSLRIAKNTTCAVIGESGCGKTSLLYALAGLIRPSSGKIAIGGEELNGIRKGTSMILQDYGLLPWKTVWDNIAFPLKSRGFKKEEVNARVSAALKCLGIGEHAKKLPGELSGGQKQRVGIGRAIALEPDLLLMDEPSSALDAITREHMQNLILRIYKERRITLVLVTHNIEEAVFLGQKIIVMGKGKIRMILDNTSFGVEALRDSLEFYRICLQVRRWLNEEA
jgi:NitT/TauT family transport system ATP-binding protein